MPGAGGCLPRAPRSLLLSAVHDTLVLVALVALVALVGVVTAAISLLRGHGGRVARTRETMAAVPTHTHDDGPNKVRIDAATRGARNGTSS